MKLKLYRQLRAIVLIAVLTGMGVAVALDSALLALIIVGGGMVMMSFINSQVKEKMVDERVTQVSNRASRAAFVITLPILGLTSVMLLAAGEGEFYFLKSLGIVLSYVTCVMVGVYLIAWFYFNKQSGG